MEAGDGWFGTIVAIAAGLFETIPYPACLLNLLAESRGDF